MAEIINLNKNKTIKQSNRLVEARYNLTKYEQRMMIAICSQLNKNADEFETVRMRVADMAEFCNFDSTKAYSHVKNTILRLLTRTLQIKNADGSWYATHWLQSAKYIESASVIEYKVDSELKIELLQLKKAYLDTAALPLMKFNRDYSARLYFILKKMVKVGDFEYELDYFRDRFQLGKTYEKVSNFKNRIFEPALAEINEKSDITVEHEYIKEGRSYKKIRFVVSLKENVSEQEQNLLPVPNPDPVPDDPPPMKEDEKEIIERLAKYEIATDYSKNMIKRYGVDLIDRNLKYAYAHRQRKENMAGWIIDCIKNDRSLDAEEAKTVSTKAEKAKTDEMMKRLEPIPKPSKEVPKDSPFLKFARKKAEDQTSLNGEV